MKNGIPNWALRESESRPRIILGDLQTYGGPAVPCKGAREEEVCKIILMVKRAANTVIGVEDHIPTSQEAPYA